MSITHILGYIFQKPAVLLSLLWSKLSTKLQSMSIPAKSKRSKSKSCRLSNYSSTKKLQSICAARQQNRKWIKILTKPSSTHQLQKKRSSLKCNQKNNPKVPFPNNLANSLLILMMKIIKKWCAWEVYPFLISRTHDFEAQQSERFKGKIRRNYNRFLHKDLQGDLHKPTPGSLARNTQISEMDYKKYDKHRNGSRYMIDNISE